MSEENGTEEGRIEAERREITVRRGMDGFKEVVTNGVE